MRMTTHRLRALLLPVIVAALTSCATPPTYVPAPPSAQSMSVWEARRIVRNRLAGASLLVDNCCTYGDKGLPSVTGVKFVPGGIQLSANVGDGTTIRYGDASVAVYHSYIRVVEDGGRFTDQLSFPTRDVTSIADALVVALDAGTKMAEPVGAQARFDAAVESYRAAHPKPELPEAARRFKVQAESAVKEKQFDEAADSYAQGLELAPWWPEGHYNRALVLAETSDFSQAMTEMKRYLALVPDAANARAAQDKIYEWEGKAGAVGSTPVIDAQPPAPLKPSDILKAHLDQAH